MPFGVVDFPSCFQISAEEKMLLNHSRVFVNNQLDAQFFDVCVYFYSLHVSGSHVPIIRRINPLNPELIPICYLLALLGAHHFLHVSRIRVKSLTLRGLMSYIYMKHPFLMFLDHTQRRSTVGRTPLDE